MNYNDNSHAMQHYYEQTPSQLICHTPVPDRTLAEEAVVRMPGNQAEEVGSLPVAVVGDRRYRPEEDTLAPGLAGTAGVRQQSEGA
jgi:hypothetical protein